MPSSTPILDLEAPLPERAKLRQTSLRAGLRWWQTLLVIAGFVVVAPAIAIWFVLHPNPSVLALAETVGRWFSMKTWVGYISPYSLPVYFIAYLAVLLLPTVIHELAHALAGVVVGFELQTLRAGPFRVTFQKANSQLQFFRPAILQVSVK